MNDIKYISDKWEDSEGNYYDIRLLKPGMTFKNIPALAEHLGVKYSWGSITAFLRYFTAFRKEHHKIIIDDVFYFTGESPIPLRSNMEFRNMNDYREKMGVRTSNAALYKYFDEVAEWHKNGHYLFIDKVFAQDED